MYKYGNLIFNNTKGWVFIFEGDEEDLDSETLISSLNHLGESGWELIHYDDALGYILKKKEEK